MSTEILLKSRSTITAQGNGTALTAGYDPNSGSYTGDAPAVIDNTFDGGSENAKGASFLDLELNVTTAPGTAATAQIYFCTSNNGTDWTKWAFSHTVPASIATAAGRYRAGIFQLTAQYTKLAVMSVGYGFYATLYATPVVPEVQ